MIKGQLSLTDREYLENAWNNYYALNGAKSNAIDFGATLYEKILRMKEVLIIMRKVMECEPDCKRGKFNYELNLIDRALQSISDE